MASLASRTRCPVATSSRKPQRILAQAQPAGQAVATGTSQKPNSYFVINNVFKVKKEHYDDFEETWRTRESHLKEMKGFMRFAMLKCTNVEGKYISQTTWATKADFEAWTKSSQFQSSHSKTGQADQKRPSVMQMLEGPPSPEMFETVTTTEL